MDGRGGPLRDDGPAREVLWRLPPSTPLALEEAAELLRMPVAQLVALADSGALLHESGRRNGRDVRVVRVVDLRDLFRAEEPPAASPEPAPDPNVPTEREIEAAAEAQRRRRAAREASRAAAREAAARAPEMAAAEAPRPTEEPAPPPSPEPTHAAEALGARPSDTALAPLLTELRARLDEAERERRASTAGLLLAQRRLLALESTAQPIPWHRRSGVWTGAFATLAGVALWFDLSGELGDASDEARRGRQALAASAARLDGEVDGLERQVAAALASHERTREETEALRRLAEARATEESTARRAELERMERERELLVAKLDELRRDADAARATLGAERDAGAREREHFAQRLDAAERELTRARAAVEEERRLAAGDREAFLQRMEALQRTAEQREAAARDVLAVEAAGLRAATQRAERVAGELEAERARTAAGSAAAAQVAQLVRRWFGAR